LRWRSPIIDSFFPPGNVCVGLIICLSKLNYDIAVVLNSQDWDTFSQRHTDDVIVRWPGQSEPTRGLDAHQS